MPLSMGMLKSPNAASGGAFPSIATVSSYGATVNASSHVVPMPSGIVAGNLLVSICGNSNGVSTTMPSGWSANVGVSGSGGNLNVLRVNYKIATGTEGANMTITTASNCGLVAIVYRITGNRPDVVGGTDLVTYGSILGNTAAPDQIINAATAWGSAKHLWLNAISFNSTSVSVTSYPTGYSLGQTVASTSGGANAYRIACCAKQFEGSQEDPDPWALSASSYVLHLRPTIRPPS